MALVLSFAESGDHRCQYPTSPDYSPLTAAPSSPRAASPEYTPVSLHWRPVTPEHGPSTTLRLGPPIPPPPPLRRAASPDYSPQSSPSRPASSPEYTPLVRCGWRARSPDYAPSTTTPTYRVASPEYTPVSRLWRAAGAGSPDHRPWDLPPGAAEYPDRALGSPARRATSPDYAPSTTTPIYRVASPQYTPVSRLWRAVGSSPDRALGSPPRRAASPEYTPRTPPARAPPSPDYSPSSAQLVPDAESSTSSVARRYRRRFHPYQRRGVGTCTWSASGIKHGQRHLVY